MNILRTREPHVAPDQLPKTPIVWFILEGEEVVLYQKREGGWHYEAAPPELREFVPDTSLSFAFCPERMGDLWAWRPEIARVSLMQGDAD